MIFDDGNGFFDRNRFLKRDPRFTAGIIRLHRKFGRLFEPIGPKDNDKCGRLGTVFHPLFEEGRGPDVVFLEAGQLRRILNLADITDAAINLQRN